MAREIVAITVQNIYRFQIVALEKSDEMHATRARNLRSRERQMKKQDEDDIWYQPNLDVFLNRWFANYDEARKSLESDGGFLLPFKGHFFVCERDVIQAIGLEPDDPDWEKIGRDCARPADPEAYKRLREKRGSVLSAAQDVDALGGTVPQDNA